MGRRACSAFRARGNVGGTTMKNLIGATIDQYQILVKVRETGTRVLFRAYDPRNRQHVGVEVVKIQAVDRPALLNLLNEQAGRNAKMDHPNIASMIASGIHEDMIYLVYDFYPARPLRRFFNRKYPWHELARELVSVSQAVAHAHQTGICHGFLNPNSVVLNDKKAPILFDFGFERIITDHILARAPGAWINKWGYEYCAPEQLNGAPADERSDVYSMGVILYEWITGEIPLHEQTPLGTLRRRMAAGTKDIKFDKDVPPAIQTMIEKCLAVNPADRYQSMQEVGVILARGALDLTITRSMVRKPLSVPPGRPSLIRPWMGVGLALVLAIGAGLAWAGGAGQRSGFGGGTETASPAAVFPTKTLKPTLTPAATEPVFSSPTAAPTRMPASITFPLFQETPVGSVGQAIQPANVQQMIPISVWGIGDLNDLTVSPDGRYVAAGSSRGLFIFDPDTLELRKYIDTYSWVNAIEFSPDSGLVAAGDRDGLIRVWDTNTWREITETVYSGHTMGVLDLAFSPDGKRLASVALDNHLIQWNVGSREGIRSDPVQVPSVSCVTYSSDGGWIVTGGGDFKINVWSDKDLSLARSITSSSKVVDMAGVKDAPLVLVGGSDRKVTLVSIAEEAGSETLGNLQFPLIGVAASSDGRTFAAGDVNGGIFVWKMDGTQVWRRQGDTLGTVPGSLGRVHNLAFSPDGKTLYSASRNGALRSLDAGTGQEIRQNQSLDAHANRFTISHNGKYLISQHDNNTVKIWEIVNGRLAHQVTGEIKTGNPFSRDDRYFALSADPSTVKVYSTESWEEIHVFNGHQKVEAIQFVQNDAQLAAGYDQVIRLWSMSSGQELKTKKQFSGSGCSNYLDLKDKPVLSITNYQLILTGIQNKFMLCNFNRADFMKAFYVDEVTGNLVYGGNSQLAVMLSESSRQEMSDVNLRNVVSAAINPAGDLLAAAFDDNTIHIWDVFTRREIMSLFGHSGSITDLRFTPDGKFLISSSLDGTIRLWGVPK